jgi:sulfur relay (sulfurtransferase) complex TusBCD TusD component (DsrE family)
VNILVVVTQNPQGDSCESSPESSSAGAAKRFVAAANRTGHKVPAVFFQLEGVQNALDSGGQWKELAKNDTELLICSSSFRKIATEMAFGIDGGAPQGFEIAGLVRMWDIARQCDRVVTF